MNVKIVLLKDPDPIFSEYIEEDLFDKVCKIIPVNAFQKQECTQDIAREINCGNPLPLIVIRKVFEGAITWKVYNGEMDLLSLTDWIFDDLIKNGLLKDENRSVPALYSKPDFPVNVMKFI